MKRRFESVDLLPELRAHVARKYKTQKVAAASLGVSTAFVSAILSGKRQPTQRILDDAGINCLTTVIYYKRAA